MSTASVSIPVPGSGFGAAVDVSSLVGEKTVALSGRYRGAYVLYGSHDGVRFAPLLIFNAGGIEGIKLTFRGSFAWVKLKSLAQGAAGVSAAVSGLSIAGGNSFASLGVGTVLDLGNDLYQVDLNFMGFGQVNGAVVVEGSLDGFGFNPIGEFASTQAGASLLGGGSGIEFSPVACSDRIRYVRLNVQGNADPGFIVTVGGARSDAGGSETLAAAYAAGMSSVDQTMVLSDAKGGKVVFDATGAGFTGAEAVDILGHQGRGGLCVGPSNLGIGMDPGDAPYFLDPASVDNVAIGIGGTVGTGVGSVVIGNGCSSYASSAVIIGQFSGTSATPSSDSQVAIGNGVVSSGESSVSVGKGSGSFGINAVAVGPGCQAQSDSGLVLGNGSTSAWIGDVVIGTSSETRGLFGSRVVIGNNSWADFGDDVVAIGEGVQAGGANSVAVGQGTQTSGENEVALGCGATVAAAFTGGGIAIGNLANVNGDRSIVLGVQDGTGATPVVVQGSDSVAIGSSGFFQQTGVYGDQSLAVGWDSSVQGDNSICIGSSSVAWGVYSVALGNGASSGTQYQFPAGIGDDIAVGNGASVEGLRNLGIGTGAGVGGTFLVTETDQVFVDCVAVGSASWVHGTSSVAIGNTALVGDANLQPRYDSCVAIGNQASVQADRGLALGYHAGVSGHDGMAFGNQASAGSGEIVFSSSAGGGASRFEVVGSTAGNPDLFSFDVSQVGAANTTAFTLLVTKHDGLTTVALPVSLSAPDPITNMSALQVLNT